jgi:hypothetical protein
MNARELFEKAGCNACAVAVRETDVQVYCSGGHWLLPAAEWERYQALCAQWRAVGVDEQPWLPEAPPLRPVLEALRRELGEIRTAVAAAGVVLDAVDLEDALVVIARRLEGCEMQVEAVLALPCREIQKGGAL